MSDDLRIAAIPDTDGELLSLLRVLEEVMSSLIRFDDDPEEWDPPAGPLGDGSAVEALGRVAVSVAAAERAPATQPVAPDGRFELIPLRFVTLSQADMALVATALADLGRANLRGDELVADTLADFARQWSESAWTPTSPVELLAGAARAHGLLDLATDDDTLLLAERLPAVDQRVVLSGAEQAAYDRLTERALGMFHIGDPLARFLYRGG
jgi:hypothetical protein